MGNELSHLNATGHVQMVDVGDRPKRTERRRQKELSGWSQPRLI